MSRIPDERPLNPKPEVIAELRRLLPAASVLATQAELAPYECDGLITTITAQIDGNCRLR